MPETMKVTRETTAQTAKRCRAKLKAMWPGTKFSVRSHSYAGGSSIDISWTDGPAARQVRAQTEEFAGATFDGMVDMASYKDDVLYVGADGAMELIDPGADYVQQHRTISQEWRYEVAAQIAAATGEPCDLTSYGDIGPDGEQVKRNGAGWEGRYAACVIDGEIVACGGIMYGGDYASDIFYRATDVAR